MVAIMTSQLTGVQSLFTSGQSWICNLISVLNYQYNLLITIYELSLKVTHKKLTFITVSSVSYKN